MAVDALVRPAEDAAVGWRRRVRGAAASVVAVAAALAAGALLLLLSGVEPLVALRSMLRGAVGTRFAIEKLLTFTVPLLIIGLGLAVSFRGRIYNIGAEGQFLVGALAGTALALSLGSAGGPAVMLLATLAGTAAGAAWGWVVGVLRGRWGVNEVILSLLLNYVAFFTLAYSFRRPLRDPSGLLPESEALPRSVMLPTLPGLRVHVGLLVALALVPVTAYVLARTPFGFRIDMLGMNPEAAELAGVDPPRTIAQLMTISGALAGLAGMIQMMGVAGRLQAGLSPGFGFTGIVVALIGRNRPVGVLLGALFMAGLVTGGQSMAVTEQVPFGIVLTIQGLFVVFLLVADRLARRSGKAGA